MTTGKKLAIALAVALPLVVLGAGIAMAADDIPGLRAGDGATLTSFGVSNSQEVTPSPADCDDCTGPCASGTGVCNGSGDCDGSGNCVGSGECDGSGNCVGSGECDGSGTCLSGSGQGNCSRIAASATSSNRCTCGGCTR